MVMPSPEGQASAPKTEASNKVTLSREEFIRAVSEELKDHFRWTSVEGLVELEAETIAGFAYARIRGARD